MKYFKTKRHLERYIVIFIIFIVPLFIYLEYSIIIKITFLLPIILIPILSITDLTVDNENVVIDYPFLKIVKKNIVKWSFIESLKVNFRKGLTHGALMPSYIEIETKDGDSFKVYYKLTKKELELLKSIVDVKGKAIKIINNPFV